MCSVKRENNSIVLSSNNVILDIEGTTTSISFVKDVLFPYVRKNLKSYVEENLDSEGFQVIVNGLRIQAKEDKEKKLDGVIVIPEDCEKDDLAKAVIENVLWQMDLDSKAKSLKDLQGLIMEIGYKKGEIKGHVYEDVEPNLKLWSELEKKVYIYSSGSVHAQKLLYGHSEKGDLLQYIKGHFDTTVGKKGDAESYKKIVEQITGSPSETVFFTDIPKEAKAAKEAGLLAILLSREGNAPLTDEDKKEFQVIKSFSEIQFENNSKKRKVCTNNDDKNDNKSVESCEVSLKTLKEPTHSTLIQQPDVNMEVEESSIEENNCDLQTSCEKLTSENLEDKNTQQNLSTEDGDIEMKPTKEVVERNQSEKDDNVAAQSNKDVVPKETVSEELKIENNEQDDKNKKVNPDEPNELFDNCQQKVEPMVDKSESENSEDAQITTVNEREPSNEMLKANQDFKEPIQDTISENGKITQDQPPVNANSNTQTQHNGDLTHHNSTSEVDNKCEPDNTCLENKTDVEVVIEKGSEKKNKEESLNPDINGEEKKQSKLDLLKDSSTNENGLIGEKKLSESSQESTNGNYSVNSKATNSTENAMDVDEKPCLKECINSDNGPSITSPKDIQSMDLDASTDKPNGKTVETPEVIDSESVKESKIPSMDSSSTMISNTDVKVNENSSLVSEVKTTDDSISENIQSDATKSEEISSEQKKPIEVTAEKSGDSDTNSKPCIETTVYKSLLETSTKPQNVDESNLDEFKSGKTEMGEVNIQVSKEIAEVCNDKSDSELCSRTEKGSKLNDSVSEPNTKVDLEEKSDSIILVETQNVSDNIESSRQNSSEPCNEKNEITKLPQITDEKLTNESDCKLNAKEAIAAAADMKNDASDDLSKLDKKEETIMSVNGKEEDNSKSIECGDKEMKNEIDETSVCEVKKCEVPENTAVAAVVED